MSHSHEIPGTKGPDPLEWAERDEKLLRVLVRQNAEAKKRQEEYVRQSRAEAERLEAKKIELAQRLEGLDTLRFRHAQSWFEEDGFYLSACKFDAQQLAQIMKVAEANNCELSCFTPDDIDYDDCRDAAVVFSLKPR